MSNEIYSGTVHTVKYADGDFHIAVLVLDGEENYATVTAKGHFPAQALKAGTWVSFEGRWINDARFGRQLQVTRSPAAIQNWTDDRVLSALTAQEIGPSLRRTVHMYARSQGIALQELLDKGDLSEVSGIDDFTRQVILTKWQNIRTYLDAASFMAEAGIPSRIISKVWSMFGTDLQQIITQDPWILVQVPGISFSEVDEIAIKLGLSLDNPGRVRGAVLASVQEVVENGHVFSSTGQLVEMVTGKIPSKKNGTPAVTPPQIATAIKELAERKILVVDRETAPNFSALYDTWHYEVEVFCAENLAHRVRTDLDEGRLTKQLCQVGDRVRDAKANGADLKGLGKAALENWAYGRKTSLTEEQMGAALHALTSPVSLLTGLPGTGKTTTLRAVVSVAQDAGIPFLLVAPTGIAAKRMASVTGAPAATIHRAFGASKFMEDGEEREATYVGIVGSAKKKSGKVGQGEWEFGPGNPHPAEFVIVDESSMLDLHMLYRLLQATSEKCRIMFVGDPYQLPSVGAGDVLRDMVNSKVFAHTHLTTIFRQEGTSGIVLAAHAIHAGKAPKNDGKDFLVVEAESEDEAADKTVRIAQKLYESRKNFQILSPRHGGDAGVTALNQRLRLVLNPGLPGLNEKRISGSVVREGDRIMVVKNDYDRQVYNGDVGKISRIDKGEIEIKVFEGPGNPDRIVIYKSGEASKAIRLAYAQTVHKSQGQEYDVIVIPLLPQFGLQLQRNLFYTAVTRAREKVFIVGTDSAIEKAVRNNKSAKRNTLLDVRLLNLLGAGVATGS
jgi:exodeoxyribonuclease V alpha subunit